VISERERKRIDAPSPAKTKNLFPIFCALLKNNRHTFVSLLKKKPNGIPHNFSFVSQASRREKFAE